MHSAVIHGRGDELARIGTLVDEVRAGAGQALVLRGEAGIGKSTLLATATTNAGDTATPGDTSDLLVLRGAGVEAESAIPFAGLHLLLHPVAGHVDELAEPHAGTLRRVLSGDGSVDRFAAGVALLELLGTFARSGPVLVLADDVHWFDAPSADALSFAARRLSGTRVGVLLAVREPHAPATPTPGLPELRLSGVDDDAARRILAATELPRHRWDRVVADACGNPLALLELGSSDRDSRGDPFADVVAELPPATRTVLLVAAADGTCDIGTILAAAGTLGASIDDLRVAEDAELVMFTEGCFGFRHPLVGTSVYRAATLARRLEAHRALAEVLSEDGDADRRARHLAAATTTADESVAAALETGIELARVRGGMAAVADDYERAAHLSPRPRDEGFRLTSAARAAADAGQPERARDLAEQAAGLLPEPVDATWAAIVRATLAEDDERTAEAHHLLVTTARRIAAETPESAGKLLFLAVGAAWRGDDPARAVEAAAVADELALPGAARVRALATAASADVADAVAAVRDLVAAGCAELTECTDVALTLRSEVQRSWWSLLSGDPDSAYARATDTVREARRQAATGALPAALEALAQAELHLGELDAAARTAAAGLDVATRIGQRRGVATLSGVQALVAAVRGDAEATASYAAEADPASAAHALALLDLGDGRTEAAVDRLAAAHRPGLAGLSAVPDLVEAASRTDRAENHEFAAQALADYVTWAEAVEQPQVRAVALRSRGLLGEPDLLRPALGMADRAGPWQQARTELAHGEWLRRERNPVQARPHLRAALTAFDRLGARPWADRARTELRAAGEGRARRPSRENTTVDTGGLTPQELRIAALAADGLSNRDIGNRLYLSPRTVGYHLYKAYPKLGVSGRGELAKLELMA
ncbi:DNA-binding CsgD family transcriptional regulator/tetratricopeptide (TPR) repeat protein [Prauserella isguenensis]|uniref:DNA-binding CsgD family transcriptional regulator/tetratricopeptide (TPR) repeat protein n=1 Tax=Prauserella isguenensis TaxID=1470180 RepID=A0A839RZE7_9PSEU|nr:LuxR family transcriptional regulator [Prauserella isguenensis]MBB3049949.1 DNA-binding CsgD family transcriptional regulator/tetratricopeptide (TPR) repeat protein [Prauserella isguenensis]